MSGFQNFQVIAKPAGPICNLDCSYCFYLEKEALFNKTAAVPHQAWDMPDEVLENYILQKLESNSGIDHNFIWQGGEPTLLGAAFFERVVELQRKHGVDKRITNALQTNAVLLDDTWGEFLKRHDFLVGVSIDGPSASHDAYRVDKAGRPSLEKVLTGLEVLKRHGVEFNILTTIHTKNQDQPLEIYRYLKDMGSRYMQFIPIVDRGNMEWSVNPAKFGDFLSAIFDEWVAADVGEVFVQNFDVALEAWTGRTSSLCVFNKTCGADPVIEHNGDVYSCDHFVEPQYKIGNVLEDDLVHIMQSHAQEKFGRDKRDTLPEKCLSCEFRFACHGGCPKDRFSSSVGGDPQLNYLCEGYLKFFNHIDPYMSYMANELRERRSPANVMSWNSDSQTFKPR